MGSLVPPQPSNTFFPHHVYAEADWPMSRSAQLWFPSPHWTSPSDPGHPDREAAPIPSAVDRRHSPETCGRIARSIAARKASDLRSRRQSRRHQGESQRTEVKNCGCIHAQSDSGRRAATADGNRGSPQTACCTCAEWAVGARGEFGGTLREDRVNGSAQEAR